MIHIGDLRRLISIGISAAALAMLTSCADGERPLPELAAAAGEAMAGRARYASVACWFELRTRREVACGGLTVPENWDDDNSRLIHLPVVTFRSQVPGSSREPLVMLSGGPGGRAGVREPQQLRGWLEVLQVGGWAHDRDVIVLAQRGTNWTDSDLSCPSLETERSATLDEAVRNQRLADCGRRLAGLHDLSGYNSAQNARDVVALVRSLGLSAWSLYGVSYGTRFALTTMRLHPPGLKAVILDSVLPPSVDHLTPRLPANLDGPLQSAFAACRRDPLCGEHFPDPDSLYRSALGRLADAPISVGPRGARDEIDRSRLLAVLSDKLADSEPGAIPGILEAVAAYAEDDFWRAFDRRRARPKDDGLAVGAFMSIACNDGVPAARIVDHSDGAAGFEGGPCRDWPTFPAAAGGSDPVVSEVPTLVLAGELDPRTPPENARIAAATLPRSHVFILPMVGHGALWTAPCAATIVEAFLDQPDRRPDVACPPPRFDAAPSLLIRSIHLTLGQKLPEAQTMLEQVRAAQATQDPGSAEVAVTLTLLAGVYHEQRRSIEAAAALERALAILGKVRGLNSVEAGEAAGLLADVYYDQERWGEARTLYQRALRALEHEPGRTDSNLRRYRQRQRQLQARLAE